MDKHRMAMMPSDVRLLYNRCSHLLTEWLAKEPTLLQKISIIWWPKFLVVRSNTLIPPKSEKDVSVLLKELCSLIDSAIPKKNEPEVQSEEELF